VDREESSQWYRRLFPALALILFAVHVALLLAGWSRPVPSLVAGLLQCAMGGVLAGAAWQAAERSEGFVRTFWRFQVCGFALWVLAQGVATVYDGILHLPVDQPWPSDLIFFLWMMPSFLSLFLNPRAETQKIEWPRWLDYAQVGILVASLYFFVFEVPSHWVVMEFSAEKVSLVVSCGRDLFILACFAVRLTRSRNPQIRALYGRMTVFLVLYTLAECPYLYLQVYERLRPGTLWDLPWSVALLLGTVLVATSKTQSVEKTLPAALPAESSRQLTRFALKLVPLLFPMAVLLMAAHIAEQQFAIAALAVISSFACSSARIVLTERQQLRSDATLRERNALLKSIFEGTGDGIFVKDTAGRYLIANKAVARYFDKPIEKIIGRTAFDLVDQETARDLTKNDPSVLEAGTTVTVDFQLTRNGNTRHFLITRAPYQDPSGKVIGVIGITRDITQYRGIEERLRQSQKMEAIGTLAGGVAHDFNNLLMVVSGYSSVLAEELRASPKLHGHVEQIQKAGERAASLTRQLLAFSRKQTIQPAQLDLNSVVTGIEKLLHRLIGENIVVTTRLASELWPVMADSGQIEQVILNLAVNARDAMMSGGKLFIETRNALVLNPKSRGQIEIKAGEYVELVVSDSGVGMDISVQSHIFEPFFTTKPPGKGTGLGLSTVYGIVQQAGGSITFESAPGAGSTFRVLLPRVAPASSSAVAEESKAPRLHGGETVLLVEDDAAVCELVRSVLAAQGYSVLAAARPQEAETICETHLSRIHLLLTDVIMPEMSGPELSKRLIALNPNLRVLFMSGYIDDSIVRQEIQERGIAYLQKPFSPKDLVSKVREVLDSVPTGHSRS
jgi:PAS domain S-box-containing protein